MEPIHEHASRLVNLQYELALLVGQELRLIPMLRRFFPPALKSLGCRAAHVWLLQRHGIAARIALHLSSAGQLGLAR
jgi:hypothetical protein